MGGLDITVSEYRIYLRDLFDHYPNESDHMCRNLESRTRPGDMLLPGYGTERPGQIPDHESTSTALDLLHEECRAWLDG